MPSTADTEVMAKIGLDMSDFKAATVEGGDYMGKLGGKIAGELTEIRKVGNIMAAAIGLDFKNIAENVARLIIGFSKEEEEALKRIEQLSDETTKINIEAGKARLNDEQRYQLLLREREQIVERIKRRDLEIAEEKKTQAAQEETRFRAQLSYAELATAASKTMGEQQREVLRQQEESIKRRVAAEEDANRLAKLAQEIEKETRERQKAAFELAQRNSEAMQSANEKARDAALERLTIEERVNSITSEIALLEEAIAAKKLQGVDYSKDAVRVGELQARLVKIQVDDEKDLLKVREAVTKEFATYAEKYEKLKFEQMSDEEKLVVLYQQQAGWQHTMDLYAENTNEYKRAYVEAATVAKQIGELEAKAQHAVTTELEAQVEAKSRFSAIGRTGSDYASQSTAALEGVYSKLQSQLNPAGLGFNPDPYAAGLNSLIQQEMSTVSGILSQRREVAAYVGRFGEDRARYQYGDAAVQQALSNQSNTLNKIATGISDLNQRLGANGLMLTPSSAR